MMKFVLILIIFKQADSDSAVGLFSIQLLVF